MTEGSIGDKIIKYAIPLAITGILQQLFNAADIAVVGRFAGKAAMAAVGSNVPLANLFINLFVGISLGTNVVIARSIGEKNEQKVHQAVHTSLIVAVVGGLFITIIGELLAPTVVRMMSVPQELLAMSVKYLRIYLLGMPVFFLYNFLSAICRGYGDTKTPLYALIASGILNVILNVLFVVGLGMDVDGVAIATVISSLASALILFVSLLRTNSIVKIQIGDIKVNRRVLVQILRIGVPAGIQGMVFSFANIIVQSAINSLGTTVIAGSSAAFNIEIMSYFVTNSFAQACTTFVGQNYGAGKGERCRRVLKLCMIQNYIISAAISVSILLAGDVLIGLFNTDPEVIAVGKLRLIYILSAYLFNIGLETLTGYLRGFGVSLVPAVCTIVGVCVVRLIWVFVVFPIYATFDVIMQVYPISLGITAIAILVMTIIIKPSRKFIDYAVQS